MPAHKQTREIAAPPGHILRGMCTAGGSQKESHFHDALTQLSPPGKVHCHLFCASLLTSQEPRAPSLPGTMLFTARSKKVKGEEVAGVEKGNG